MTAEIFRPAWYQGDEGHLNVRALIVDLLDRGAIFGIDAILEVLDEPWKYEPEWNELQARTSSGNLEQSSAA